MDQNYSDLLYFSLRGFIYFEGGGVQIKGKYCVVGAIFWGTYEQFRTNNMTKYWGLVDLSLISKRFLSVKSAVDP